MNNHKDIKPTAASVPRKGSAGSYSFACFRAVVGNFIMKKAWNRIEYQEGDVVGACIYVQDIRIGKNRKAIFICPECGEPFEALMYNIKNGHTKSCGCLKGGVVSHGEAGTRLYRKWTGIKSRCYNPNEDSYRFYGGVGIKMHPEWRFSYNRFRDYVMVLPNALADGYSIDRIDSSGDYGPGNVRWATNHQQAVNSRVRCTNKSGYKGVRFVKDFGKWVANIGVDYKKIHLGSFKTKEEAVNARNEYITENNLTDYKLQKWEG